MFTIAETKALSSPHFREGTIPTPRGPCAGLCCRLHPERKNSCSMRVLPSRPLVDLLLGQPGHRLFPEACAQDAVVQFFADLRYGTEQLVRPLRQWIRNCETGSLSSGPRRA